MQHRDLGTFIKKLEEKNELVRITDFVSPELEITEIADRVVKSGKQNKALLFENNGTNFPLLINLFGNETRLNKIFNVTTLDDIAKEIESIFDTLKTERKTIWDKLKILPELKAFASWMPKKVSGKGLCQQNVMSEPDLDLLPILKCWPADGGKFITFPLVHTIDPETGVRNMGMYRMQVFDKKTTGMHWHLHKGGAAHFEKYKKLGKKMPIAVALGGDPVYTYAATAPLPDDVDEYILAGFLRKQKVELVRCLTQDVWVPSDVDFVIEGYVDPEEELVWEGPFGDHTGFYSLPDWYPKFHITAITYKNDAIYPTTIVGIPPQEDAWIGKATERIFLPLIRQTLLPEVVDMNLPFAGVAHNLAVVSIKQKYPGHALKIAHSLWGAGQMMFNKVLIVTDDTVDVNDYNKVAEAVIKNCDLSKDVYFSKGSMDVLDHAAREKVVGGKMLIDATSKSDQESILKENTTEKESGFKSFLSGKVLFFQTENTTDEFSELCKSIDNVLELNNQMVIFSDIKIEKSEESFLVWVTLSNIDVSTDVKLDKKTKTLFVDARNKPGIKNYYNKWPRMLINRPDVIDKVDKNFENYNLGQFIESPSRKILEKYPFSESFFIEE